VTTVNQDRPARPSRRPSHRRAALGLGLLTVLAAACGSGHKKAAPAVTAAPTTPSTEATTTTPTTVAPSVYPLTGLPATNPTQMHDPAVVVKIDNVDAARPQSGIGSADVVYEAEVEGGLTRLAAVFQSSYPTNVGPVRSGRLTDEGVADDLAHPVLAFAGTNAIFMPILQAQPVTLVTADNYPGQFIREGDNAPHNLYSNVGGLASLSTTHTAPAPLFAYLKPGQSFGGAGAAPASAMSFSFPAASVGWTYDQTSGRWTRTQNGTPDVLSSGAQISAENVVVYFVGYANSGTASGEGVPDAEIPDGILTGTGNAWILSGGKVVKGTWTRAGLTTPATYTDSSGAPIALQPGNTWVELAPLGTIPTITP
jgi:hypothetical protein